ncbi:MAG: magnesium protoporphyrin IX methyltransferase [Sedimentitalea sp.]
MALDGTYEGTRAWVEDYFDRTATRTWERLTSDAPVSGIRATVRKGRDRMRDVLLTQLPEDLRGARILDAGCGTGALAVELAKRGATVTAVDISPSLIEIAKSRCPEDVQDMITFAAGDMLDATWGTFDYAMAMDSLIYYDAPTVASILQRSADRVSHGFVFTLPPRTPLLMAMYRVGKLFPRSDRSPAMVPHSPTGVARALASLGAKGHLKEIERVTSGFYISTAMEFRA